MQEIRRIHLNFCTLSFLIHQFTFNRLHLLPKQNSQQVFLEILNFVFVVVVFASLTLPWSIY